jgi:hypothetical protein
MRFTIRDLIWLMMMVIGVGLAWLATAHRSALIETRMQAAERELAECNAKSKALTSENKEILATNEALVATFHREELTDEQRSKISALFKDELESRRVEVKVGHW